MLKNPTIQEYEAQVTLRAITSKLANPSSFTYAEALSNAVYACNDIIKEMGMNREMWVRVSRNSRAFMFHEHTNRVVAEVGVIPDELPDGKRHNFRIELYGKHGRALKEPTIGDLAVAAEKLGRFQRGHQPRYVSDRR